MRRIKKAKVTHLTLCPRGANTLPVLYKSDEANLVTLLKEGPNFLEKGELTAIVYAPEIVDAQGDFASADAIKDMAYGAARDGLSLDVRHNGVVLKKEQAFVAEQFLIQHGDPRFTDMKDYSGKPVSVAGGWAVVLKIEDPALRKQYREGGWNGVSMFAPSFEAELVKSGETPMTPEEIKALASAVADAVKLAVAPAPIAKTDEPPKFSGPLTLDNLRKHKVAVEAYQLAKSIDTGNPEQVAAAIAQLEAAEESARKNETTEQRAERLVKENHVLAAELAKVKRASTQATTGGSALEKSDPNYIPDEVYEGLTKEEVSAHEHGKRIASLMNGTAKKK